MCHWFVLTLVLSLCCCLCESSMVGRSLVRRQVDSPSCDAIEGFDCKCSYYRLTCRNDRDLSSPIEIVANEKGKYQSVEIVIGAAREINVDHRTFQSIKDLYKLDGENVEFRVKFEKFSALHLSSAGIFNGVFPENLPSNVRKHLALEIYNPEVQPREDVHLFQNLNVDTLELYALYPFHGSFQQLFQGANIKYLRLSGGDIRSDVSQSFTGNIARLELAKQASALSAQNFPVYPCHELIINAFYITEFNVDNPPNYENLGELRIHSPERIPANAFRQFPNLHTLAISTEKEIDPQAFNGLNHLEKLIIKDTKVSIELLNNVPQIKEFETNLDKLDEKSQCQFLEKLANGQISIQAIPNGRECNCLSAYLDTAAGRTPCDAQHCEHSPCSTIKNNYDQQTRLFKSPPLIRRADGSDASRAREAKIYSSSYQISSQDRDKLQRAFPSHSHPQQQDEQQQQQSSDQHHQSNHDNQHQSDNRPGSSHHHDDQSSASKTDDPQRHETNEEQREDHQSNRNEEEDEQIWDKAKPSEQDREEIRKTSPSTMSNENGNESDDIWGKDVNKQVDDKDSNERNPSDSSSNGNDGQISGGIGRDDVDGKSEDGHSQRNDNNGQNPTDGETNENRQNQEGNQSDENRLNDGEKNVDKDGNGNVNGPAKKGMSWLPIIIIVASIVGLLLLGALFILIKKKRAGKTNGYQPSATQEPPRA